MHRPEQQIQPYLDDELGPEEKKEVVAHLAECVICRVRFDELQRLSTLLQYWTLPPGLRSLSASLFFPLRRAKATLNPGLTGWLSGITIALFYVLVRTIFSLSSRLTLLSGLIQLNSLLERSIPTAWRSISFGQPFYLAYLGELGEKLTSTVAILVPLFVYGLTFGIIAVLYFSWLRLIWPPTRSSNRVRS